MTHQLNGNCQGCEHIFNIYPNFCEFLKSWFKKIQETHPEAHISWAGRGRRDQEIMYNRTFTINGKIFRASKAKYGESAHNANAAIDIWQANADSSMAENGGSQEWFNKIILTVLAPVLEWYGMPGSSFPELGHVQMRAWKEMLAGGQLRLVE